MAVTVSRAGNLRIVAQTYTLRSFSAAVVSTLPPTSKTSLMSAAKDHAPFKSVNHGMNAKTQRCFERHGPK
jgi:hypothetical protein